MMANDNIQEKSYIERAKILEKPNKLASLKNSFHTFKKMSNIELPKFLKKRQEIADYTDMKLKHVK